MKINCGWRGDECKQCPLAPSGEDLIRLEEKDQNSYAIRHRNGVLLGEFSVNDDGYFVFWPELRGGYWDEHVMRVLCDQLKAMNAEWDAIVRQELGSMSANEQKSAGSEGIG